MSVYSCVFSVALGRYVLSAVMQDVATRTVPEAYQLCSLHLLVIYYMEYLY